MGLLFHCYVLITLELLGKLLPIASLAVRGGRVASPHPHGRTQKLEGQSATSRRIGKVLRTLVDLLCLGKKTTAETKPTKREVRSVLRVLTVKHFAAAAAHQEVCSVMDQTIKLYAIEFFHLKVAE